MEAAKLPPPIPDRSASTWYCHSGVSGFCNARPVPNAGIISSAVVKKMVFLPPAMRIKNVAGMRSVAPERPAIAVSVNSSEFSNG